MNVARLVRPLVLGAALIGGLAGVSPSAEAQYYGRGGRDGWAMCGREGEYCQIRGPALMRYGIGGRWIVREVAGGAVLCATRAFGGDPAPNVPKACFVE